MAYVVRYSASFVLSKCRFFWSLEIILSHRSRIKRQDQDILKAGWGRPHSKNSFPTASVQSILNFPENHEHSFVSISSVFNYLCLASLGVSQFWSLCLFDVSLSSFKHGLARPTTSVLVKTLPSCHSPSRTWIRPTFSNHTGRLSPSNSKSHHPESAPWCLSHSLLDHVLSGKHVHVHPFAPRFIDVFSWN